MKKIRSKMKALECLQDYMSRLYVNFSDAQGQLTPKSVMEFCQNSNEEDPIKNDKRQQMAFNLGRAERENVSHHLHDCKEISGKSTPPPM